LGQRRAELEDLVLKVVAAAVSSPVVAVVGIVSVVGRVVCTIVVAAGRVTDTAGETEEGPRCEQCFSTSYVHECSSKKEREG